MRARRFLFLQGNATPFYRMLGAALDERGQSVLRINVCGGDRAFWGDWQAIDWPGSIEGFDSFIAEEYRRREITDLVLFGDCRPLHRVAIAAARHRGIEAHVFEEGYLRPDWVTLERQGVNGYSRLPDEPDWYRELARGRTPPAARPTGSGLHQRILYDAWWQASNYLQHRRYPRFWTHRPMPIWAEYATWTRRLATLSWRGAQARTLIADLARKRCPFFLFPLQLDTDYQIRVHSNFGRMHLAIEAVIDDFAAFAPAQCCLVLKNHPLDNGWVDFRRRIKQRAKERGVADRVLFIDGGDLTTLIEDCHGIVTVNSTVGLSALVKGKAAICLGTAVYDVPGMTHQGSLAEFWRDPDPPDAALVSAYQVVLQIACLVNGGFYTREGMALAAANSIGRLLDGAPDILRSAPPRRTRATRLAAPAAAADEERMRQAAGGPCCQGGQGRFSPAAAPHRPEPHP